MSVCKRDATDDAKIKYVIEAYLGEDKPTVQEVARRIGVTFHTAQRILKTHLPPDVYRAEKALRYSRSKRGPENPMFGKVRELHHNYKGVVKGKDGYLFVLKPDWYTGRTTQKHVPMHHVVMCEALGITEISSGFHVHHINGDITDNRLKNLALVSAAAHQAIHHYTPLSEQLSMWELNEFLTWKLKKTTAS